MGGRDCYRVGVGPCSPPQAARRCKAISYICARRPKSGPHARTTAAAAPPVAGHQRPSAGHPVVQSPRSAQACPARHGRRKQCTLTFARFSSSNRASRARPGKPPKRRRGTAAPNPDVCPCWTDLRPAIRERIAPFAAADRLGCCLGECERPEQARGERQRRRAQVLRALLRLPSTARAAASILSSTMSDLSCNTFVIEALVRSRWKGDVREIQGVGHRAEGSTLGCVCAAVNWVGYGPDEDTW